MAGSPGVSMMLMLNFSRPLSSPAPSASVPTFSGGTAAQSQKVAADWMVIPFSRSRSIESILAPAPSFPRTWQKKTMNGWSDRSVGFIQRAARSVGAGGRERGGGASELTSWMPSIFPV